MPSRGLCSAPCDSTDEAGQLLTALKRMNGTQQNVEQSAAAAESLQQQAAGLLEIIAQFKTVALSRRGFAT